MAVGIGAQSVAAGSREGLPELAAPLVDGFGGDQDTAGHHQFLDLPQAQREAVVQPHAVADDLHWVAVPLVTRRRRGIHEPSLVLAHLP